MRKPASGCAALTLVAALVPTAACAATPKALAIQPQTLARLHAVDQRFQSHNVERALSRRFRLATWRKLG